MLAYEELKANRRRFLSLTSLTPDEFADLMPAFERAYRKRYPASQTVTGKSRKRKAGAGRKGALENIEQRLLFILVYQKSYPLQSILAELFGISQGRANEWIHRLLPILKQALDDLSVKPLFIEPGSPSENGYIESFNGKMRDELLNREIFYTLKEAQLLIERWRKDYNHFRPHSSLGYCPPAPQAWLISPLVQPGLT